MRKMSTKTVSLSEDAYERLKSLKKKKESFSDVVRRITDKTYLRNFHGVLSEKAAEELERSVTKIREEHEKSHEERLRETEESLKS